MNLYVAMSALQGMPDTQALAELVPLAKSTGCTGIQLTPGNAPVSKGYINLDGLVSRYHHTYSKSRTVGRGWEYDATTNNLYFYENTPGRSIHPPFAREASIEDTCDYFSRSDMLVEIPLYKEYLGASYSDCMALYEAAKAGVAVDISHLFISRRSEGWTESQIQDILKLPNIREIHVSANDGRRDQHRALNKDDFGLDWARERAKDGVPIILECYMHKLDPDMRRKQIDIVLGE